jgi:type I restriction enzyme R subunit
MAYEIVKRLKVLHKTDMLQKLEELRSISEIAAKKKHRVFEISFDAQKCFSNKFLNQKLTYIHNNLCNKKWMLATDTLSYPHSSAYFYETGKHGMYEMKNLLELEDNSWIIKEDACKRPCRPQKLNGGDVCRTRNGFLPDELSVVEDVTVLYGLNTHSRDKLEEFIRRYNQQYGTSFSTKTSEDFDAYYKDISKKLKDREKSPENLANRVDILLVVNMFLTGFDAKKVSTLYVDKNLKYHGLVQAYSRTNRILNDRKSQGNIVVFRNLKQATDDAITLFSNKEAIEEIILKPYDEYVKQFNRGYIELLKVAPTVKSVDELETEEDELAFVQAFRELIRVKNVLASFADFKWSDLSLEEQQFEDYKSKYLNLHDKVKSEHQKEKVSVLDDVDFELELIHRDEINVAYIIQLLIKLKTDKKKDAAAVEREISNLLNTEAALRSKRELIEQFIRESLPDIQNPNDLTDAFGVFWNEQRLKAFECMVKEENLSSERTQALIEDYLYSEQEPLRDDVLNLLETEMPSVLVRRKTSDRILGKIKDFIDKFISGMAGD